MVGPHTHALTHTHAYTYALMHIGTVQMEHTYTLTHTRARARTHTHTHTHTATHTDTGVLHGWNTHTHAQPHTHARTHTHTHGVPEYRHYLADTDRGGKTWSHNDALVFREGHGVRRVNYHFHPYRLREVQVLLRLHVQQQRQTCGKGTQHSSNDPDPL